MRRTVDSRARVSVSLEIPIIVAIAFASLPFIAKAQSSADPYYASVAPATGLKMRSAPDLSSDTLAIIPGGERVRILDFKGEAESVQDRLGVWTRVDWKGCAGWCFGGFLLPDLPSSEAGINGAYEETGEANSYFFQQGSFRASLMDTGTGEGSWTYDKKSGTIGAGISLGIHSQDSEEIRHVSYEYSFVIVGFGKSGMAVILLGSDGFHRDSSVIRMTRRD